MDGNTIRRAPRAFTAAAALLAILASACGASAAGTSAQRPATTIAPATSAAPAVAAAPGSTAPASSPAAQSGSGMTSDADLVARGKVIFEQTAGGVGCAYCHGLDGKGTGPAGVKAAFIQGKKESDVRYAMRELPMMAIVKLTDDEVTAVVAYLQTLVGK